MGQSGGMRVRNEDTDPLCSELRHSVPEKSLSDVGSLTKCKGHSLSTEHADHNFHLSIRFERTVFCGDISYEYTVRCSIDSIPSWKTRLTVEDLTKYTDTLLSITGKEDAYIPDQHGKVMRTETFTDCLQRILSVPNLLTLQLDDATFNEATADLFSIPFALRPILQYDDRKYDDSDPLGIAISLKQTFANHYEYLSTCTAMPSLNRFCCDNDDPDIRCTSHWLRVLSSKLDLLIIINYGNVHVVQSDLSRRIVHQLMDCAPSLDDGSAWIIADFLPKRLVLNGLNQRCQTDGGIFEWQPPEWEIEDKSSSKSGSPRCFEGISICDAANSMDSYHALCARLHRAHLAGYGLYGAVDSVDFQCEYLDRSLTSSSDNSAVFERLGLMSSRGTSTGLSEIGTSMTPEYLEMGSSSDSD